MTEQRGDEGLPEPRQTLDEYFVTAAKRTERPASERVADARRIAAGHADLGDEVLRALPPQAWRTAPPPAPPARGWSGRMAVAVVVALCMAAGLVLVRMQTSRGAALGAGDGIFGAVRAHPPLHEFPDPSRILAPAPSVAGSGDFTVLDERGGSPITWDPCQPIHFVVRPDGEIPGGRVTLDAALAEVSKDTGLFFMDDGATTEPPNSERDPYQPDRYGQNWAPVLITWSNDTEYPGLAGDVVGLAGPIAIGGKNARIVSGEVVFDARDLSRVQASPEGATYVYDVMLHELGHLVGLGHVDDPSQVMNPVSTRPLAGYGSGDLRGLAALGSGRCFTTG
jgi:hypothetical protein